MKTDIQDFPGKAFAVCIKRKWSTEILSRGAYLHLESSELIESIRGKRGDPAKEAADVLFVLMSICGIFEIDVEEVCIEYETLCEKLMTLPRYDSEEIEK